MIAASGPPENFGRSVNGGAFAQLAGLSKNRYMRGMESKFGCTEKHVVVLQDHKRLPARFFARVFGALTSRLS